MGQETQDLLSKKLFLLESGIPMALTVGVCQSSGHVGHFKYSDTVAGYLFY